MTTNNNGFEDESLKRYVKISMIIHVGLFLALTIKATFFNEPPIKFEEAIRVDLVGLPDKLPKEAPVAAAPTPPAPEPAKPEPAPPPKPEPPPPPKEEPKPVAKTETVKQPKIPPKVKDPDAINLDKAKNKQKQALEKLKQMEALEAIQKDVESENKKKAAAAVAQAAQSAEVKYKGNVVSPGTSLTGIQKLQAETYVSDVHKHMIAHWALPEYLKNRKLRTDVLVRFDENGLILSKEVVKSSGNPAFDEFVLSAIQKSSPVPTPPAKFAKLASVQGFLFRFSHDL